MITGPRRHAVHSGEGADDLSAIGVDVDQGWVIFVAGWVKNGGGSCSHSEYPYSCVE